MINDQISNVETQTAKNRRLFLQKQGIFFLWVGSPHQSADWFAMTAIFWNYIEGNPIKWMEDKLYTSTGSFHPFQASDWVGLPRILGVSVHVP